MYDPKRLPAKIRREKPSSVEIDQSIRPVKKMKIGKSPVSRFANRWNSNASKSLNQTLRTHEGLSMMISEELRWLEKVISLSR